MKIVQATLKDLDKIMAIYAQARIFMKEHHNDQWGEDYPSCALIEKMIDHMYLCMVDQEIACVFYFSKEEDKDYKVIDGAWLTHGPYSVVHLVASTGKVKGAAKFCLDWAFEQMKDVRMDTYKDNIPMQKLLHKCGFCYCGTIQREDKSWLAYEKICKEKS